MFSVQWGRLLRILISATFALGVCLYLLLIQGWQWTQMADVTRAGYTLFVVVTGVFVYVAVAAVAGLRPSILKH